MSKQESERITALNLCARDGEKIFIDGPTQIVIKRTRKGRALITFIGPASTRIAREAYLNRPAEPPVEPDGLRRTATVESESTESAALEEASVT